MSTASWLLRCSQSPSDAKMMNLSVGCIWCTVIAGSELRSGLLKVSGRRNLECKGSLLNSGFFRYTSPIDLVICKTSSYHMRCLEAEQFKMQHCMAKVPCTHLCYTDSDTRVGHDTCRTRRFVIFPKLATLRYVIYFFYETAIRYIHAYLYELGK